MNRVLILMICCLGVMLCGGNAFADFAKSDNGTTNRTRSLIYNDGTGAAVDNGFTIQYDFRYPAGFSYDARYLGQFHFLRESSSGVSGNIVYGTSPSTGTLLDVSPASDLSTFNFQLAQDPNATGYVNFGSAGSIPLDGNWHRVEIVISATDTVTVLVDGEVVIPEVAMPTNTGGEHMGIEMDMRVIADTNLNPRFDNFVVNGTVIASMDGGLGSPTFSATWGSVTGDNSTPLAWVNNANAAWPYLPEGESVDAIGTPDTNSANRGLTGSRVEVQTFTVDTTFTLNTVVINSNNFSGQPFWLKFYEVSDIVASSFTPVRQIGDELIVTTSTLTGSGLTNVEVKIDGGIPIVLPALTPPAGYAVQIGSVNGTTVMSLIHSNNSAIDFAPGRYYRDDNSNTGTAYRDFGFAFTSFIVPVELGEFTME